MNASSGETVDQIDEQSLEEAGRVLGTKNNKDTVNAALREVVRKKVVADFIAAMSSRNPAELEAMRMQAWRG